METTPLVSLVTPAFNQGEYLAETIESVLSQDYPSIEYIVIDDGSTDTTPHILERYAHRITAITQQNVGQARTLNRGWSQARGKYIGYLSSDDVLYPSAVSSVVEVLERDLKAVAAYPDADNIDRQSRVIRRNVCKPFDYDHLVVSQECFIGPGALFRKAAYEQAGGWRPELRRTPDREFWMRLGLLGTIVMVPRSLAGYRLHPESTSFKEDNPEAAMEYVRVTTDIFENDRLPVSLKSRKSEAIGFAYLVVARTCFRAGQFRRGLRAFSKACAHNPAIGTPAVIYRHARSVVGRPFRRLVWQIRKILP